MIVRATIALAVGLSSFERLDLAAGSAPFAVTPPVVLSLMALVELAWDRASAHSHRGTTSGVVAERTSDFGRHSRLGWFLLFSYLLLVVASLIVGGTGSRGLRQVVLIAILSSGMWAAVALAVRRGLRRVVVTGAWVGLVCMLAIDALQLWSWLTFGPGVQTALGPLDITSPTYGAEAPRPAALSIDPNRGAFAAVVMFFLIAVDPWSARLTSGRARALAALMSATIVVTSFSRSAIVAWVLVFMGYLLALNRDKSRLPIAFVVLSSGVVVAVVLSVVTGSVGAFNGEALVSERLDFSLASSGGIHLLLYKLAGSVIGSDPWLVLTGVGFGNSHLYLTSVFGSDPDGNFHSLYATALVELGIAGLAVVMAMVTVPLLSGRWSAILGLIVFSGLYQSHLDATFWLVLGLAWLAPGMPTYPGTQSQGSMAADARPLARTATRRLPRPTGLGVSLE